MAKQMRRSRAGPGKLSAVPPPPSCGPQLRHRPAGRQLDRQHLPCHRYGARGAGGRQRRVRRDQYPSDVVPADIKHEVTTPAGRPRACVIPGMLAAAWPSLPAPPALSTQEGQPLACPRPVNGETLRYGEIPPAWHARAFPVARNFPVNPRNPAQPGRPRAPRPSRSLSGRTASRRRSSSV